MLTTITKNWPIKLICLAAAIALWFFVSAEQNTVAKFPGSIAVKTVNIPENLSAILDSKTIEVTAIGKQSDWRGLTSDSFNAYVDLSGLSAGVYQLPIQVYSRANGISVVRSTPDKVVVRLEPIISKNVSIEKSINGLAGNGLVVGDVQFEPDHVQVQGAESTLTEIDAATAIINLDGETSDFDLNADLSIFDTQGQIVQGVTVNPTQVKASVHLIKGSNVKTVGIAPKITGTVKDGFFISAIQSTPSVVELTGDRNVLNSTNFIETYPINIAGVFTSLGLDVNLNLPSGVQLLSSSDNRVHIEISVLRTEVTREISLSNLSFSPTDVSVENYSPNQFTISVGGGASLIEQLQSSDFTLHLDLSGRQPGKSYVINLTPDMVLGPTGVNIRSINPASITVRLR